VLSHARSVHSLRSNNRCSIRTAIVQVEEHSKPFATTKESDARVS
jgi:hypothetical protein